MAITAAMTALACSDPESSSYESEGPQANVPEAEVSELGPVRAQLSVEDGDLVILVENRADYDATVAFNVSVDSPNTHSSKDVGEIRLLAGEARREFIKRESIDGFDLANDRWLRAELRYRVELDDGRSALLMTALAARDGLVVPKDEAIEAGLQVADRVVEGALAIEKALGDPFKVCFTNALTFDAFGGVPNDGLSPNLAADSGSWPFYGQVVYAIYPASGTSITVKELDANGCVTLNRRQSSGSESWRFRMLAMGGVPTSSVNATAYVIDNSGSTPAFDQFVTVPATGSQVAVTVDAPASIKPLYTSVFLAVNSLRRITSVLGLSPPSGFALRISPSTVTEDPNLNYYCPLVDANSNCPTAQTLRVGTNGTTNRGTIAHEVGHHVHHWYTGYPLSYDYTEADSGLPVDACQRDLEIHNQLSIEWQSAAHHEGLADFFRAVTYNNTAQSSCSFEVDGFNLDCEALGEKLRGNGGSTLCAEWNSTAFFDRVGNELDWTKMYWDFLTDQSTGTNFSEYMEAERSVGSSLPEKGNHFGPLRQALSNRNSTLGTRLRNAANGNIFDGSSH